MVESVGGGGHDRVKRRRGKIKEENMSLVPVETACSKVASGRFGDLRGVRWRVDLRILPSSSSASIDDIRRVTANSRRRYAALRKQLLVDPHMKKDGCSSSDLVIDNPLSQNPDSTWSQFFRTAELEKMLDQDLARLYPERGSYFQTSEWQGMLRRILLLWCLNNPKYGYRQGMHELLAPFLYVLHMDVQRLAEVRKAYADHFADNFDDFSYHESGSKYRFDFKKFSESMIGESKLGTTSRRACGPNELDPLTHTIVLISDCYGAEGELGILLSEKFMEHDAYSMFDALMSGAGGGLAMADFYSASPCDNSHSGFTPVIEASAAMYHLLSVVDTSLHSHLVELGVEPQYFSLRWLRVMFGREYSLENLLLIWDEIFACDSTEYNMAADGYAGSNGVLDSPRGAFISAFAVSMILNLRSSLLATENATTCLQRLLSFPDDINLEKMITKATSLQSLAVDVNSSKSFFHPVLRNGKKPMISRDHNLSLESTSPRTDLKVVPDSYWEEKWRDLHKEEHEKDTERDEVPTFRKRWSERVKLHLSSTESDPTPSKKNEKDKSRKSSVRRNLLEDLARQLGDEDEDEKNYSFDDMDHHSAEPNTQAVTDNISSGRLRVTGRQENTPDSSDPDSPVLRTIDLDNDLESSSITSGLSTVEKDTDFFATNLLHHFETSRNNVSMVKSAEGMKDKRTLSAKFQWLWKFGQNVSDGTTERQVALEDTKSYYDVRGKVIAAGSCAADRSDSFSGTSNGEVGQQTLMVVSFSHLGQSMLDNIKVIESVFQKDTTGSLDNLPKHGFVGKGQVAAISALKELRKISNLLSEI